MQTYGSILTGLITEENINPQEFNKSIFNVPIENYVKPNLTLKQTLSNHVEITTVIFSNSPKEYLLRLVKIIGIEDYIKAIYDRTFLNYLSKPNPTTFQMVLNDLNTQGEFCLIVDDKVNNLEAAKSLGMKTVLITHGINTINPSIDHKIDRIEEIGEILNGYRDKK